MTPALFFSELAHPRVPARARLLLPRRALRRHADRAARQEDEDAARLDALLPPGRLPGGRHGAVHGRILLGKRSIRDRVLDRDTSVGQINLVNYPHRTAACTGSWSSPSGCSGHSSR